MMRKSLAELLKGQPSPPKIDGIVDVFLRDADGNILQHEHKHNLITEYHRLLFLPNGNFAHHTLYVFINETNEPAHFKRTMLRTTLPGTWAQNVTPSLDGTNRIWTYQTVFSAPPAQRTIRSVGLARRISTPGYTNVKSGPAAINAMTILSSPIVQSTTETLEVSYRLALQRT